MTSSTSRDNGKATPGQPIRDGAVRTNAVVLERAGAVADAVDQLAGLLAADVEALAGLDPDGLRDRMRALNRLEGLTTAALATTSRALTVLNVTRDDGASSAAAWLQANGNRSHKDAAHISRLATDLGDLPETRKALTEGAITPEAADVIVQAARDATLGSPTEVDRDLIDLARTRDPSGLRREIQRRTQQATGDRLLADERAQRASRRVGLTRQDDGMWRLYGLLPSESGERMRTLLNIVDHPDPKDTPPERRRRPDQRLADALDTAVGIALDHATLPATGGVTRPHVSVVMDATTFAADLTDPDSSDSPRDRRPGDGFEADDIAGTGDERPVPPDHPIWAALPPAELGWGGQISPQAARRICCDAAIARLVAADSRVLDVGRTTRVWSSAQRRAVNARDRGCRGPNCNRPIAWTQIHHLRWWRHGGPTDLNNGLALCHHCHHLVHDVGWHVTLDPDSAAATWTTPDRRRTIVTHPRPPS
jgi:hypothetical protein